MKNIKVRVAFVALFISAACNPGGGGCAENPGSELRFVKFGQVLNSQTTVLAATFNAEALAPVPTTALPHFVDLFAVGASLAPADNQNLLRGRQVEAHLFAADLPAVNAQLRLGALESFDWDALTNPSVLPSDVILPYPPSQGWDLSQRYSVFMGSNYFWPNAPPLPPASDPNDKGSIKHARIYYPGLCSQEVSFTDGSNNGIFDQLSDGLWQTWQDETSTGLPFGVSRVAVFRNFSRVTTLLDEGLSSTGPRGGFFLDVDLGATFSASVLGDVHLHAFANYEYAFTLQDGRVAVEQHRNELLVAPQGQFPKIANALENTLPDTLRAKIVAAQQRTVPLAACTGNNNAAAIGILSGRVQQGAGALGLGVDETGRLQTAVSRPENYVCVDGFSKIVLRAKRLNVFPDAMELVWFDDENPDDPMFALYVALVGFATNGGLAQPADLCGRTPLQVGGTAPPVGQRTHTTVSRGLIEAQ